MYKDPEKRIVGANLSECEWHLCDVRAGLDVQIKTKSQQCRCIHKDKTHTPMVDPDWFKGTLNDILMDICYNIAHTRDIKLVEVGHISILHVICDICCKTRIITLKLVYSHIFGRFVCKYVLVLVIYVM